MAIELDQPIVQPAQEAKTWNLWWIDALILQADEQNPAKVRASVTFRMARYTDPAQTQIEYNPAFGPRMATVEDVLAAVMGGNQVVGAALQAVTAAAQALGQQQGTFAVS